MRYRALIVAFLAICLGFITACSEGPVATADVPLTYDEIRNTGLANKCPQLSETARGTIDLSLISVIKLRVCALSPPVIL
jgi:photosystem II oxygen-evolving enhancer protein 1